MLRVAYIFLTDEAYLCVVIQIEPSQKEAEAILKIESVLNDLIEKDTFDVADYLDYQESGSFRTPFVSRRTFRPRTPLLSEPQRFVKKQYGACDTKY